MEDLHVVGRLRQVVTKSDRRGEAVGKGYRDLPGTGQVVPGSQPGKVLRGRGHLHRSWGMGGSMERWASEGEGWERLFLLRI